MNQTLDIKVRFTYIVPHLRIPPSATVVTDRATVQPRQQQAKSTCMDFDLCCYTAASSRTVPISKADKSKIVRNKIKGQSDGYLQQEMFVKERIDGVFDDASRLLLRRVIDRHCAERVTATSYSTHHSNAILLSVQASCKLSDTIQRTFSSII